MRLLVGCLIAFIIFVGNVASIWADTEEKINYRCLLAANGLGVFLFICLMFILE